MPFVVIYDANALYGNAQRDLLIRIARSGLVQAKWTDEIMDEMIGSLGKKRPDIGEDKLVRLRELMNGAVADCLVTGYEPLTETLELRDPDDRHVSLQPLRAEPKSSSRRTRSNFPQHSCSRGMLRRSCPMISCLTRSTLTRESFTPAYSRSRARPAIPLAPLKTC